MVKSINYMFAIFFMLNCIGYTYGGVGETIENNSAYISASKVPDLTADQKNNQMKCLLELRQHKLIQIDNGEFVNAERWISTYYDFMEMDDDKFKKVVDDDGYAFQYLKSHKPGEKGSIILLDPVPYCLNLK